MQEGQLLLCSFYKSDVRVARHRSRVTFWLTLFLSDMLPLFLSGKPRLITKTRLFNLLKILPPKIKVNFQIKILIFFFIFLAQNIDCGYSLEPPRRGGSNEYQQSMFSSKNK